MNIKRLLIIILLKWITREVHLKRIRSLSEAKRNGFDCFTRGGREMLLKASNKGGSYLQSIEQSTGKITNHKNCLTTDNGDVYCETWNVRDLAKTMKTYKFKGIDHEGNVIWEGNRDIVPQEALFYCMVTVEESFLWDNVSVAFPYNVAFMINPFELVRFHCPC